MNTVLGCDITGLKEIGSNNTLINCVFVGNNISIGNNCTLKNVTLYKDTTVTDSYLEDCTIGSGSIVGPFSRVRGKTTIGNNCKIGNFVEIKNSTLKDNVKASHLSYIGDATIGDNTNIGCGVVFANYDGVKKHHSVVGKNCFIGSNVNIIAPVNIADDSFICAGTTVTQNTERGDFCIGRVRAEIKKNYSFYLSNKQNQ